jgi:hypothetical protein
MKNEELFFILFVNILVHPVSCLDAATLKHK